MWSSPSDGGRGVPSRVGPGYSGGAGLLPDAPPGTAYSVIPGAGGVEEPDRAFYFVYLVHVFSFQA
jgi:hypothetical protein